MYLKFATPMRVKKISMNKIKSIRYSRTTNIKQLFVQTSHGPLSVMSQMFLYLLFTEAVES